MKYLFTIILLLGSVLLVAQEVDLLHLKNGSIIRGRIIEVDPAVQVRIRDMSGNLWVCAMEEVDRISSEEPGEEATWQGSEAGFGTGFVNLTSMGFLAGSSRNEQAAPFSLVMVNGWMSQMGLFAGAGVGIEFLNTTCMPLFADVRMDLNKGSVVPYLVAKGGWSLPLAKDYTEYETDYSYQGGPLFAMGMGLKVRTRQHFAWDIGLMYRYQETSYSEHYDWNNQEYDYTNYYNRIEIRLGFYLD